MGLLQNVSRLASASLDLLFPPRCVGCDKEGNLLCDACRDGLPLLRSPFCLRCAQPMTEGETCRRCLASPLAVDGVRSPLLMEGAAREAAHRLKYDNLRALAPLLGAMLAETIAAEGVPGTVLVPVPLHRQRERQRGYNQAHLLAREAGARLGLPVVPGALVRLRETFSQARGYGVEERRDNVRGAFGCPRPDLVKGAEVVLVDDVCTTGATLDACAAVLKGAGADTVWGVTVAREA